MRLFLGIPLADETSAQLAALVAGLRTANDGLRWTAPASWHITLQFLGESSREAMQQVLEELRLIAVAPVRIDLEAPGCFERAGVFHVAVRASAELAALQQKIVAATARCGFAAENRPFRPHITLARVRERGASAPLRLLASRLGELPGLPGFTAPEFLLYESFLEPSGARYQVRARFALAGQG